VALEWDCVDKGKSGKDMNRPELERALSLVRSGQAGGIIVSKLDRLSRSFLDFAYLMETARKEGLEHRGPGPGRRPCGHRRAR
jgi:DNA invertase Pin-like site-specific DNA recombinase